MVFGASVNLPLPFSTLTLPPFDKLTTPLSRQGRGNELFASPHMGEGMKIERREPGRKGFWKSLPSR
jgi:hypothetical protein